MSRWHFFIYRKRKMAKGISIVLAIAAATLITLVSCSGITKPCVGCQREIATDPFSQAEEAIWEDRETAKDKEAKEKRRSSGKSNL